MFPPIVQVGRAPSSTYYGGVYSRTLPVAITAGLITVASSHSQGRTLADIDDEKIAASLNNNSNHHAIYRFPGL